MGNPTRARLMNLGKTQMDLLREIRKRGYPKCTEPYLSKVNNGLNNPVIQVTPFFIMCDKLCNYNN